MIDGDENKVGGSQVEIGYFADSVKPLFRVVRAIGLLSIIFATVSLVLFRQREIQRIFEREREEEER